MDKLMTDYLTDEKVLISSERALRPHHYKGAFTTAENHDDCPFCPDNKNKTPGDILFSDDMEIRVIPNKYPAIKPPTGYHDVIIDTKKHDEKLYEFTPEHMNKLFSIMQKRTKELYAMDHIKYIQIFKNDGISSGASITHSHWQIIAMDFIPYRQETIHNNFEKYFLDHNLRYMDYVYSLKDYIVYENENAFAFCPEASPYGYYTNIALKNSHSPFENLNEKELYSLSDALLKIMKAYNKAFGDLSYNIMFQMAPNGKHNASSFYMGIVPRLGTFAGFELATGCYINHTPPIEGAKKLRGAI